jgi:response regulator RpfG family c-di-GMP phosphodiesterase
MLEHDEDDRYITQAVFDEHQYDITLHFISDRDELFLYLENCSKKADRFPSLILLNYHAIPTNAVDIIVELKDGHRYNHIPVVVLSGSVSADIIQECYSAGACSFIQKPTKSKDTEMKIQNFFNYWFETVELPN